MKRRYLGTGLTPTEAAASSAIKRDRLRGEQTEALEANLREAYRDWLNPLNDRRTETRLAQECQRIREELWRRRRVV